MLERKTWHVDHLDIVDEPMAKSLIKYRHYQDRQPSDVDANVVSSNLPNGKHAPIVDLDIPHEYVPSTSPGHGHLYLEPTRNGVVGSRFGVWLLHVIWRGVFFMGTRTDRTVRLNLPPHRYVPSTTPGHGHMYIEVEMNWLKWFLLNLGLYLGGVTEKGYFIWSLRRRGNYVRRPGVKKTTAEEKVMYSYGMFFRLRGKK